MRAPLLAVLLSATLLTACSGSGSSAEPPLGATQPPPDPCQVAGATSVPASCIDSKTLPPGKFSSDPAKIPVVLVPPVPNSLARDGNDKDPAKRKATFTVTLPAGARLATDMICSGNGTATLDFVPKTAAFQSFECNNGDTPGELITEDPTFAAKSTTYTGTFTATGASRWSFVVYSTTEATPK